MYMVMVAGTWWKFGQDGTLEKNSTAVTEEVEHNLVMEN